jgi:hydrogenase maturation protease
MPDLREQLEQSLRGRACLLGIGNVDYGDDGFGVRLAEELIAAGMPHVVVAGTNPERVIGRLVSQEFAHIVFLDAVEFGESPGSLVFLNAEQMAARFPQVSTHKISLGLLAKWVEATGTTKAWLLGVQPESVKPGPQLTATVRKTLRAVNELLVGLRALRETEELSSAGVSRK